MVNTRKQTQAATTIQKYIRTWNAKKKLKESYCKRLVSSLFNAKQHTTKQCFFRILQIMNSLPPFRNDYKFLYGKLIELQIINLLDSASQLNCINLDNLSPSHSNYKFDCSINHIPFSIKASKNTSSQITVINKRSKKHHVLHNINYIICFLLVGEIYIFPHHLLPNYLVQHSCHSVALKKNTYKYLKHNCKQFCFSFPKLSNLQLRSLDSTRQIDLYSVIQNKIFN